MQEILRFTGQCVAASIRITLMLKKLGVAQVVRRDGQMELSPNPDEKMRNGEILVILGYEDRLAKLYKL